MILCFFEGGSRGGAILEREAAPFRIEFPRLPDPVFLVYRPLEDPTPVDVPWRYDVYERVAPVVDERALYCWLGER